MTLHVLHAGDGYQYLTRQVATGDVQGRAGDPISAYYHAAGAPPGRWVGSGCSDLNVDGVVHEHQMQALFGEGLHPHADEMIKDTVAGGATVQAAIKAARLGRRFGQYDKDVPLLVELNAAYERFHETHQRRPTIEERRTIKEQTAYALLLLKDPERKLTTADVRRFIVDELGKAKQPVSGFDLVFTPVKSVSVLWALGGYEVREAVEDAHEEAWRDALAWGEKEGAYTRTGAGGIAQVDTSGFVATAFDHRDSRTGDPNLHTHVAISNRVLAADGKWRTLDSRQMHRIGVAMSERYNARIQDALTRSLGVHWIERSKGPSKRPVREIDGIPEELIKGFSRRREQIEAGYQKLVADYVRAYGHTPPRSVQLQLAQRACLEERPDKEGPQTLAQQIQGWEARAAELLPGVDIRAVMQAVSGREPSGTNPAEVNINQLAGDAVARVQEGRSTWTTYHLRPEVERQLNGVVFASSAERDQMVDAVLARALDTYSVKLDIELDPVPKLLQRSTGEAVFRRRGSERYSSEAILSAESRLVAASQTTRGPAAATHIIDAAIRDLERGHWKGKRRLNPGQRELVHHFVGGGRALAVAIGPPGTGKSTAMRAVRAAWETTGGRVIGLAPSAAAASVLGDELGVKADTMHSLVLSWLSGSTVDVRRGDMLLVDEAGMAGTLMLDHVRRLAEQRGAVVRLVGDHRQLTAVEAGGALRLIVQESGSAELVEVRRFADPAEAATLLKVRVGDETAANWYAENNRLVGGVRAGLLDSLFADWQRDQLAGKASIMISDTNDVVRQLSAHAQLARRINGVAEHDGVELRDGTVAGVGDRIVTRLNKRKLTVVGARDYVKNGDLWEVIHRSDDGRLRVQHIVHGGIITLPADYVREWVELGYAATIHRSQGLTVDIGRAHLSPSTTRESALVALSRGVAGNYGYVETDQLIAADEPAVLPGDVFYRERNLMRAVQALVGIIRHEGAESSATEELRDALEWPARLDNAVPQFEYGLHQHRGREATAEAEGWVRDALPDLALGIFDDDAWPALVDLLHQIRDFGSDPVKQLRDRADDRELDSAESIAQVMHWRISEAFEFPTTIDPGRPIDLPGWVPTPPSETPFPEYRHLPEHDRETAVQAEPAPNFRPFGGPDPHQLIINTTFDPAPSGSDAADVPTLFDVGASGRPAFLGPEGLDYDGPDPDQLMLFDQPDHDDHVPACTGIDPAQLALFSADEPHHQTDLMDLANWVTDQADRISTRVRVLADRADERTPVWVTDLGPVPDDPLDRQRWLSCAGQVAAYRERYGIPDTDPALLGSTAVRGRQARARDWTEWFITPGRRSTEPAMAGGRGPRTPSKAGRQERRPEQPDRPIHRQRPFAQHVTAMATEYLNSEAAKWVKQAMPAQAGNILADSAWPALADRLRALEDAGSDPVEQLRDRADDRELDSAESIAQVMHWRLGALLPQNSSHASAARSQPQLTDVAREMRDRLRTAGAAAARPAGPASAPTATPLQPVDGTATDTNQVIPAESPAAGAPVVGTAEFWQWVSDSAAQYLSTQTASDQSQSAVAAPTTGPSAGTSTETAGRVSALRDRLARLQERLNGPAPEPADVEGQEAQVDGGQRAAAGEAHADPTERDQVQDEEVAEDYRRQLHQEQQEGVDREP